MFRIIKRIMDWTGDKKKRLYIGFIFSVLNAMCHAFPIMATAYALNWILEDMAGNFTLTQSHIFFVLAIIIASILLRWLFSYIQARLQESVAYEVSEGERLKIGETLKRVPLGFFKKTRTGDITTAMTTELSFFEMHAMSMIDIIGSSYLFLLLVIIGFFTINPLLGAITLTSLGLSTFGLHLIQQVSRKNAPMRQDGIASIADASLEFIRGMAVVKSYNQEGSAVKSFANACAKTRSVNIKLEEEYAIPDAVHRIGLYLGACGILCAVSLLATGGDVSISMWIMLALFSFTMFNSVEAVNNSVLVLEILDVSMNNLDKVAKAKFIDEDGKDIELENYDIEFKNVQFSYDTREVIKDVSFTIPQNSTLAIVGASGSGKTTLCNLLARFYDVDSGSISLGGHDIREMTCMGLLKNITMVFQNVYMFHDTIENNIKFGKPDATMDEVIAVAKKACCHDFIMELPNAYQTLVGEGGGTLSGGEKQRVSIARAMLKDAPIVILDEATASVDPENEHLIQSAISELTHGKTIITIAHRLATIENADHIIVMDDGKIAEQGLHAELLAHNGIYKKFISIREAAEGWQIK